MMGNSQLTGAVRFTIGVPGFDCGSFSLEVAGHRFEWEACWQLC